ncbi:hypothetical protein [Sporosarcina beigongshangi]|uniref:hypothetical protein n=1 Tax=Sporosarcina beigongshangi TaxID=2782538 RepID=UPI00193AD4BB|nr:hypothetical protein [Sporosarcina beigongshangi]
MNKVEMKKAYCEKNGGTRIRKFGLMIIVLTLLAGCSENGIRIHNDSSEDSTKVEQVFKKDPHLTGAVTVFHENNLLMGVTLKTFSRFKKEKIEKDLKKQLEKQYPELDVTVSADGKIWMEANKLIKSSHTKDMTEKIDKLKLLLKEET